ncbi:unnamed protein product [Rhizoctonia solani]|uniref:WAP domain-containing protein n=1 Tax=Rhizoctonia solani TaxID=456999 RepID=A0A8H3H1R2_9AGAM|nr:unnamed protein product [Rhizoctonia solani]
MKSFFALLAGFVLLAPAVLASPFPGGDGDGHGHPSPVCLPVDAQCGGDKGKCCDGFECKEKGGLKVQVCCKVEVPPKGGNGH